MHMQKIWSTSRIDLGERKSYWTDAVCGAFVQLECDIADEGQGFYGHIETFQLGSLGLSRIRAAAQNVQRTSLSISKSTEDYLLVNIQIAGRGTLLQDGRKVDMFPGDFALYDSNRPYQLRFNSQFEQLVLTFPGPVLRRRMRDIQHLTAYRIDGTKGVAAPLLVNMVHQAAGDLSAVEPASAAAISESVANLLVAGLMELPASRGERVSNLALVRKDAIKAYVVKHLQDPMLSVERIAAVLRVTTSTVYRAWVNEPTSLHSWIWALRLDGIYRALCDPSCVGKSITEIAYSWGFNDPAHFSRAFRKRFGHSPKERRLETIAQIGQSMHRSRKPPRS